LTPIDTITSIDTTSNNQSVHELVANTMFKLVPNPTVTKFTIISVTKSPISNVFLTDILVNIVYSDSFNSSEIDISNLSNGVYLLYFSYKKSKYS